MSISSLFGDDAEVLGEKRFQLLLLANMIAPLGTALPSPILDSLTEPFGVSPANIGLIISAFTAPAIVVIPITGVLSDRFGRKPIMLIGLVLFGAGGTGIALTTDFRIVLALRFLQGFGFAALSPIIITSIGDLYTGMREATAQGLRFTGSGLAQTVVPLLAGTLVVIAWQYPFLLYAIAFPVALILYLRFDEPTDGDGDGARDRAGGDAPATRREGLTALVVQRRVLAVVIARGLPIIVWIGFLTYNSIVVVRLMGGTPAQAGLLAAIGSLSYAVAATQTGRVTSRVDSRLYPLLVANLALGVGFGLVLVAGSFAVAVVGTTIMGAGFGVVLPMYRSIITGMVPTSLRGGLVSLAEAFGRVMATLTPIAMGVGIAIVTPRFGFQTAIRTVGLSAAVITTGCSALCLLVASRSPPVRVDD